MRRSLLPITVHSLLKTWILAIVASFTAICGPWQVSALGEEAAAVEGRLSAALKYLSSDELEGRGIGTKGLDQAADFLAAEFAKLGLKTDLYDGQAFQKFKMSTGSKLGERNEITLTAVAKKPTEKPTEKKDPPKDESKDAKDEPEKTADKTKQPEAAAPKVLKLNAEFRPMSLGGTAKFDLPLVFVGYGISAKDKDYDDYAGVDVKDKLVIVLRKIPQQGNPHSIFGGDAQRSEHAPFTRKVSNAYQHGAAGVIFVNDAHSIEETLERTRKSAIEAVERLAAADAEFKAIEKPSDEQTKKRDEQRNKIVADISRLGGMLRENRDPLLPFGYGGADGQRKKMPIVQITRAVGDALLKTALGKDLAALEKEIDKGPTPHSHELDGCRLAGEVQVEHTESEVKNVVAVLEGEGPLADETIVIGAHYDHLGLGGAGSFVPNEKAVHNGADDNGSGAVTLLEVARRLTQREKKLPRRIVFIAFTGEEEGLFGSEQYVREPKFPLDKTIAMLNMDMVGRLVDDKLIAYGTGTATEFDPLIEQLNKTYGFKLTKHPEGFGPSDHSSFYAKKIPVFHFFTGTHKDYHRPTDDFEKINVPGMRRIGELVSELAVTLAESPKRPQYIEVKQTTQARPGGDRPYFGSIPDLSNDKPGYALMGVAGGGPAEKGGLKGGDLIIKFGESKIGNLSDFDGALRKYKAGDRVPVIVTRDDKEVKLEVVLDPPR